MKFINELAKVRLKRGMPQKDFSKKVGDAQGNVSRKESRNLLTYRVRDLIVYSRALDLQPSDVIEMVEREYLNDK